MVYNERLAWKPYRLQPSKIFGWVAFFPRINSWVKGTCPSHG